MFTDGRSFLKRATIFLAELRKGSYPNASRLAELACCSRNTAQRTIDRLKNEHGFPAIYDEESHGYYLTDRKYELPLLTPGKDELTALLLLRDLSAVLDGKDLQEKIDSLWYQYAAQGRTPVSEPERLARYFSSDLTVIGVLSDWGVLELLEAAASGRGCEVVYKSPWRHKEEKTYRGRILEVHFSDGNLYVLFYSDEERNLVFNASFLKSLTVLDYDPLPGKKIREDPTWMKGFGVWSNEPLEQIEVRILPPASNYYAAQVWQEHQEDHWDGDILVRCFDSAVSPELTRRILSLGAFVDGIKPVSHKERVAAEARHLAEQLSV